MAGGFNVSLPQETFLTSSNNALYACINHLPEIPCTIFSTPKTPIHSPEIIASIVRPSQLSQAKTEFPEQCLHALTTVLTTL